MNFTQEIKRELIKRAPEGECCRCALIAAAVDTSGSRVLGENGRGFSFTSESEEVAAYLLGIAEQRFGEMTLTDASYDPKHGRDKLTFSYIGKRGEAETLADYRPEGLKDCCGQAYLKGAFLFGGSCTLPREGTKTSYHLEIVFGDRDAAEGFLDLLDRFQIIGNTVLRGERAVVYIKSREAISDFLSVVGAEGALRTLEGVTAAREENNNLNRMENCSAGNADRAAIASAGQVVAIEKLRASGKLANLPDSLKETAQARLENPALSLTELAELLGLTKSCLHHRLRKLVELAT